MSDFKIRRSVSIVPIETITLADGTTTQDHLHSTIDKSIASTITETFGTASTEVKYKEYLTTTSLVALSAATIFNVTGQVYLIFIRIKSAGSSGTPNVGIEFGGEGNYHIGLSGVGDFCVFPLRWDNTDLSGIKIQSSGATTVANVEIMIGI